MRRVAGATVLVIGAGASAALAVERMQDGGLEASSCSATSCTSSAWQEADATGGSMAALCANGLSDCPRVAHTGTKYLSFLGSGAEDLTVSQAGVQIPAAPAILSFWLYTEVESGAATFTASIDGQPVFTRSAAPEIDYTQFTVPVDQFAGQGMHTLSFRKVTPSSPSEPNDRFLVDDVSLDAPDVPTCDGKPATIVGTEAAEEVTGTAGADVAVALGGADVVKLGGGKDIACGGPGKDDLRGQGGRDKLFGDDGRDRLKGGGGKGDLCNGGPGRDEAAESCEKERGIA